VTNNRVVILGSQGMAGHIMYEVFKKSVKYDVFGVAQKKGKYTDIVLDATNFSSLEEYIKEIKPKIVINCIGILVSQSQNDISNAILLNSYLPHFLEQLGKKLNFKLIHISTDCVFSGKDGGYIESSFRDGNDNYARTKALGEVINNKDLTIRTSIIGPELKLNGTGLFDWFLKQNNSINGYTQAYWSGVTTLELAKAIMELIEQNITGLYHLCPKEKISKYDLLHLLKRVWEKDIDIEPFEDYTIDKSLVCTRKDFIYKDIDYESMLIDLKQWMDTYKDYYMHYEV